MDPIVTGFDIIGQGGHWAISGGSHTQSIIQGGENIVCSDIITHVLTNPDEVTLGTELFLFDRIKAQTLMFASLVEPFLTSNGPTLSNYTCREYVPVTCQKGFNQRCEHERLRLNSVE